MEYKEIQHEIEYINLKNENYDLKKELLLKDYNLNIKENRINNLLNDIEEINYKYKDLKTELELCNKHYNNAINNIRNLNIKIRNKNNIIIENNKDYPCYPCFDIDCKSHKQFTKQNIRIETNKHILRIIEVVLPWIWGEFCPKSTLKNF